jgi:L-alanine-DL-glutamate epimerase-like enolase superfamily enzyme
VRVDPLERRDLSHQQPEVARRLSESLRDWSEQPVTPFTPSDLEELRESLRALGYVD